MYWTDFAIVGFILPLLILLLAMQQFGKKLVPLRNLILLAASYVFYYKLSSTLIVVLAYVTIVNYFAGQLLLSKKRKFICGSAVILSLMPLVFFKYAQFICNDVLRLDSGYFDGIALPIGISFFTFQALTYTIDVYRGKIQQTAPIVNYALFVCFFPTIMSGPIEKARSLLKQIAEDAPITLSGTISGFQIFIWGLFKKVVVADRISGYVGSVYSSPDVYSGNSYVFAILLYSIQIYCDFSGYSDMSIGVARALGFRLGDNFRFPYYSTTISQFWKKWHISLTSWFTEYLYISCGGNRVVKWRWIINIALVFLISGLWHGAAWTFIIWGALHAVLYLVEHSIKLRSDEFHLSRRIVQAFYVYMSVSLAWVFFRCESLNKAMSIISSSFRPWGNLYIGSSMMSFAVMSLSLTIFLVLECLVFRCYIDTYKEASCVRWRNQLTTVALMLYISLFGQSGASFVYSQF